ncbi:MAG: hypothetical protein QXY41_05885 [Thermoproteota archaeon]
MDDMVVKRDGYLRIKCYLGLSKILCVSELSIATNKLIVTPEYLSESTTILDSTLYCGNIRISKLNLTYIIYVDDYKVEKAETLIWTTDREVDKIIDSLKERGVNTSFVRC